MDETTEYLLAAGILAAGYFLTRPKGPSGQLLGLSPTPGYGSGGGAGGYGGGGFAAYNIAGAGHESTGGLVGGAIGGTLGSVIGGPVGGAVGGAVGGVVGGTVDPVFNKPVLNPGEYAVITAAQKKYGAGSPVLAGEIAANYRDHRTGGGGTGPNVRRPAAPGASLGKVTVAGMGAGVRLIPTNNKSLAGGPSGALIGVR